MMHHVAGVAGALYRRAADNDTPTYDLPPWSIFVVLLDVVVFLPIILFMGYTLNHIYPTLAMIEDENPPAYEPLSLQDPTPDSEENGMPKPLSGSAAGAPRTITSSLRSVNRTLYATAGWRANFRGLGCLVAQGIASSFLYGIFSAVFPAALASLATLLTTLALIQFSTAWVHIVISAPQPKRFWHRLPSFRRAFDAAAKPAVAAWLAIEVTTWTSLLMAAALGLRRPHVGPGGHPEVPRHKAGDAGKAMAVFAVALVLQVLLIIPTQVVLVRVQASLLPPDEDTIVPFDRSFEGKVEPAVVGGKGYVGMKDAWATFSRGAWKRLVVMYVKIFVVSSALMALMAAVIVPEAIILAKHSQLKN